MPSRHCPETPIGILERALSPRLPRAVPSPWMARAALWLGVLGAGVSCGRPHERTIAPAPIEDSATRAREAEGDEVCRPVAFPDTRAGQRLEHLHRVITAADPSVAERFVDEEMSAEFLAAASRERHIQVLRGLHEDRGPVLLCRIESSSEDEVVAILGGFQQGDARYGRFFLEVAGDEGKVASLGFEPASREDLTRPLESLDAEAVRKVVDAIATGLTNYVYPDKAEAMQAKIRRAVEAGDYAGITAPRRLAKRLTRDLHDVSGDKHLGVVWSAAALPPQAPERERSPEEIEAFKKHAAGDNFGMPVAEVRDGNIGYLRIDGFYPPEVAAEAVAETMSKLAEADVLIIDLRHNGGGSPHGVALMTSYLFGNEPVHLNDIYNRSKNSTESFHTSPDVPGRKFGPKKPIFLLTSAHTFSAGEEFAYNLKTRKRATIVGATTGGGAHPTEFVRVSDHWGVVLPSARAINPVTKTNWEGTGVKPDVQDAADEALERALELARKHRE